MTSGRGGCPNLGLVGSLALLLALANAAPAAARNPLKLPDAQYELTTWAQVEGWVDDDQGEAFDAFIKSCDAILQGSGGEGQPMRGALYRVCQKAVAFKPEKPGEARQFFEQNFRPIRISPLGNPEREGFFTGYYEPIVRGLSKEADGYDYPLYRTPPNLLPGGKMAVTAAAKADDGGKKKKKKHGLVRKLISFFDRTAIEGGALAGRNLEICWLNDPIDNFFAQIQGSVRVILDDGRLMRLNYAAANGQPYYAVGRWLIDRGIISKEEMSMDRIREWMMRNPVEGKELRRRNKSYVFFRETNLPSNEEPIGGQGVSLTPGRSIAIDHRLHVYGTPFFISAYLPIESLKPDTWFRRLVIAQDTGGAIIGPARADIYFGAGDEAESVAGRLRHFGKFVMLLPKELDPAPANDEIPLPRPRPEMPVASEPAASAPEATAAVEPSAAKTAEKPATKLASTSTETPLKKPEPAPKQASKHEPKHEPKSATKPAERTAEKKASKKHEKAQAKTASKAESWESRVMPVIAPATPAKKHKSKTRG
jgi:peptidoglycan lytic transglycosylase A